MPQQVLELQIDVMKPSSKAISVREYQINGLEHVEHAKSNGMLFVVGEKVI